MKRAINILKSVFTIVALLQCAACLPHVPRNISESSQALTELPSNDKATVVFVGKTAVPFPLYDNDNIIGVVADECAVAAVSPGKHTFSTFYKKMSAMADGRSRVMFLDAELSKGKIYYVYVSWYNIPFAGLFPKIEPIRPLNAPNKYWEKLPEWLAKCKITTMSNETLGWSKEVQPLYLVERAIDYDAWLANTELQALRIKPEDGVNVPVVLTP